MWITDSCYRDGVEIWEKTGRSTQRISVPYDPGFYLQLPDQALHRDLLDALESDYGATEYRFQTVYGPCEGWVVPAGRDVAVAIEQQTSYAAQLYNVDIRLDQRYLAERGQVPCCREGEERFSTDLSLPFRVLELQVRGNPFAGDPFCSIRVIHDREEQLRGPEPEVLGDLAGLLGSFDPDVILFPLSDLLLPRLLAAAKKKGIGLAFSRSGRYRKMAEKSYWSYGRTEYRAGSLIPDGRILIDTSQSFHYRESGLSGIILGARLTGLSPNLTARFTSGTLISAYEVYEAIRRGIAVPFRKSDPEVVRRFADLKGADRGGMMLQPVPGLYEKVHEIDFTSLYPSIIVAFNLSPETFDNPGRRGFLPEVLEPLLTLRKESKMRKATDPSLAGIDSILKWMLVTCFGYTGYKNAKFGRIEVHEKITGYAREILIRTKDIAEEMGLSALHGIVDCLWVQGEHAGGLKDAVEREIGLHTTLDTYDWLAFLPLADGFGAYNCYYGRLSDGGMKQRGIAARRGDTPACVREMQEKMLCLLARARDRAALLECREQARQLYREAVDGLADAPPSSLAIHRQISKLRYARACPEASAVTACAAAGIDLSPGMEVSYVVADARTCEVELDWKATRVDLGYYRKLLEKAWLEVLFALDCARSAPGEP